MDCSTVDIADDDLGRLLGDGLLLEGGWSGLGNQAPEPWLI
jgi:hypothetical protein